MNSSPSSAMAAAVGLNCADCGAILVASVDDMHGPSIGFCAHSGA